MSETTLCKHYSEYCANAGVYHGGGYDSSSSMVGGVAEKTIRALERSLSRVSSDFAKEMNKISKMGEASKDKTIKLMSDTLRKIKSSALSVVGGSGEYVASRFAKEMLGGVSNAFENYGEMYGGSGVDPIVTHANYMVDSYEFVTGASEELGASLEARIAAFGMYLEELLRVAKVAKSVKDKDELKNLVAQEYNFIESAHKEFQRLKNLLGPSSDISKKLEDYAKQGKLNEIKGLLKEKNVNKELVDDYIDLLRVQGSVAARSHELEKALKAIGMKMEEFKKMNTLDRVEEVINKYEKEVFTKHGKDKMKFIKALRRVRDMANEQSTVGTKFEGGVCPCDTSENYYPEDSFTGGNHNYGTEDYFGGEFLGLEKEVEYEFLTNDIIKESDLLKRGFLQAQSKYIVKMLEAARKTAIEITSKGSVGDESILLFLRRLSALRAVKEENLISIFATRGKDYNTVYMKNAIISELDDLIAAAKVAESHTGPAIKEFAEAVADYKKFLEKSYEENRVKSREMSGGSINCSGVSNASIYDRFLGGEIELKLESIIDVFNQAITIGRMKNGLNLGLEDLNKYSIEQDKINESVLSKLTNKINASATEMISKYKEVETFPVKKDLFEMVLKNNVRGQIGLQHAAQAMDKKIRMYQKAIIEDPYAAKELADLLGKVTIDTNWLADPTFEDLKKFCDYFHLESVAKNGTKYDNAALQTTYNAKDAASTPCTSNTFQLYKDNSYIKDGKLSPLPYSSRSCLEFSIPTLILATSDGNFDDKLKAKIKSENGGTKKVVNCYGGIDLFPAKAYTTDYKDSDPVFNNTESLQVITTNIKEKKAIAVDGSTMITNINNPCLIPRSVKFLKSEKALQNYYRAMKHLEEGADTLLNLRNLFSVFEHIDDAYKGKSGSDDGVKIGQIYGAVKQYLILTSMYPVMYKEGDNYMCGFIGMRHFGHDIVVPFEESDDKYMINSATGDLMSELSEFNLSLREFYEGIDTKYGDVDYKKKALPSTEGYEYSDKSSYEWYESYAKRFEHEFKARYARFDLLLTMMLKSMFAKIMSVLAMYNLISFDGASYNASNQVFDNIGFSKLRNIYGGDETDYELSKDKYGYMPEVRAECIELYTRLYYYAIFYKQLFLEEASTRVVEQVVALKRFALLPTSDSKFAGIMKLLFLKKFDTKITNNKVLFINDNDLIHYISECNKLYDGETGSEKVRFEKIIKDFIRDINHRYGLVKTDSIIGVMDERKKQAFPEFERMQSREEYADKVKTKPKNSYLKPKLLDGEDDPIGNLGAPSAAKESSLSSFSKVSSLISPTKTEYKSEELLAAVYNFRRKLDKATNDITEKFDAATNTESDLQKSFSESLFTHIHLLKSKIASRTNSMDKFRILKEYLNGHEDNKLFNISPEVFLYRDLVVNGANLLYKLYVRIIGNINIYGINNEWTEPLLRGTYLYYLDSINTDLVKTNRLGKAPVLDFSTLQSVMDKFLTQTRDFHNQLRTGILPEFATRMDNTLVELVNIHRSIFREGGLIDGINYEDNDGEKHGVKIAAVNDYSEFQHAAYYNDAALGQNSFILDNAINRYPDPLTVTDPRANFVRLASPTLEFELLSQHFSPKNIYVMFEYLLVSMYKLFFEKNGTFYGPLLSEFVDSLSHVGFNFDLAADLVSELGGVEQFDKDMPFSNKVIALYKTLYKYNIKKEKLVENDLSLISEDMKVDMKRFLPMYLMLFKFIIKQGFLHVGMVNDENIYDNKTTIRPTVVDVTTLIGNDKYNRIGEITGAGDNRSLITKNLINNGNSLISMLKKYNNNISKDVSEGGLRLNNYKVNSIVTNFSGISGVKSDILLGARLKGDILEKNVKESKTSSELFKTINKIMSGEIVKYPSLYDEFLNGVEEIKNSKISGLKKLENYDNFKFLLENITELFDTDEINLAKLAVNTCIKNGDLKPFLAKLTPANANIVTIIAAFSNAVIIAGSKNNSKDYYTEISASYNNLMTSVPLNNIKFPYNTLVAQADIENKSLETNKEYFKTLLSEMNEAFKDILHLSSLMDKLDIKPDTTVYAANAEYLDAGAYVTKNSGLTLENMNNYIVPVVSPSLVAKSALVTQDNFKNVYTLLRLLIDENPTNYNKGLYNLFEGFTKNNMVDVKALGLNNNIRHREDPDFSKLKSKCDAMVANIFKDCDNQYNGTYYICSDTLYTINSRPENLKELNAFKDFFYNNYEGDDKYIIFSNKAIALDFSHIKYNEYITANIRDPLSNIFKAFNDSFIYSQFDDALKKLSTNYMKNFISIDTSKTTESIVDAYEKCIDILKEIIKKRINVITSSGNTVVDFIVQIITATNLKNYFIDTLPILQIAAPGELLYDTEKRFYKARDEFNGHVFSYSDKVNSFVNMVDALGPMTSGVTIGKLTLGTPSALYGENTKFYPDFNNNVGYIFNTNTTVPDIIAAGDPKTEIAKYEKYMKVIYDKTDELLIDYIEDILNATPVMSSKKAKTLEKLKAVTLAIKRTYLELRENMIIFFDEIYLLFNKYNEHRNSKITRYTPSINPAFRSGKLINYDPISGELIIGTKLDRIFTGVGKFKESISFSHLNVDFDFTGAGIENKSNVTSTSGKSKFMILNQEKINPFTYAPIADTIFKNGIILDIPRMEAINNAVVDVGFKSSLANTINILKANIALKGVALNYKNIVKRITDENSKSKLTFYNDVTGTYEPITLDAPFGYVEGTIRLYRAFLILYTIIFSPIFNIHVENTDGGSVTMCWGAPLFPILAYIDLYTNPGSLVPNNLDVNAFIDDYINVFNQTKYKDFKGDGTYSKNSSFTIVKNSGIIIKNMVKNLLYTPIGGVVFEGGRNEFTGGKFNGTNFDAYIKQIKDALNTETSAYDKIHNIFTLRTAIFYQEMKKLYKDIIDEDELLTLAGLMILYLNNENSDGGLRDNILKILDNLSSDIGTLNELRNIITNYSSGNMIGNNQSNISLNLVDKNRGFKAKATNKTTRIDTSRFPFEITFQNANIYLNGDVESSDGSGNPFNNQGNGTIDKNDILTRAKNAVKYATIIYKSLHKVYTTIAESPKYLGLAPYISDVYEIIGKEKNVTPLCVAVDMIPTIVNTVNKNVEANILKKLEDIEDRKCLGFHCNNIYDLEKMKTEKAQLIDALNLFMVDDKLHSITINDFPYFKSLIDNIGAADVLRSGISANTVGPHIVNYGKLVKYLYELDTKSMFANSFPIFNSVDNPKYYINTDSHLVMDFGEFGENIAANSLLSSLHSVLAIDGLFGAGGNAVNKYERGYYKIIRLNATKYNTVDTKSVLGDNYTVEPNSLLTMLELNTNTKEMLKYMSCNNEINNYNKANKNIGIDDLIIKNIIDVGIMPININSMMREIPLANTINGVYTFDILVDWLGHGLRRDNTKSGKTVKFKRSIMSQLPSASGDDILASDSNDYDYFNSKSKEYLKNPLNSYMIPAPYMSNIYNSVKSKYGKDIRQLPKLKVNIITINTGADAVNLYLGVKYKNVPHETNAADTQFKKMLGEVLVGVNTDRTDATSKNVERKYLVKTMVDLTNNDILPIAYNTYKPFLYDENNKLFAIGGKIVDTGLFAYYDSSVLLKKLVGENLEVVTSGAGIKLPSGDNYYCNQMPYQATVDDVYDGVDPNLQQPILGVNLYSDALLKLFNAEFKTRYEKTNKLSTNTIVRGTDVLYVRQRDRS